MPNIIDKEVSLIENIFDLMQSDDENPYKQSEILIDNYKTSSEEQRKHIDLCFIALCGYSLETLLRESEV